MLRWGRCWNQALLCDAHVSPDFVPTAPATGSVQRDGGHAGWDQRSMSPGPSDRGVQSGQCNTKEALTGAQRGQNVLEKAGLETESTEETCPWHQIKWPERQRHSSEPNSCRKAACNDREGKDVQNESYRAGLSYKPSILEELKVNFKLLHQVQVKEVSTWLSNASISVLGSFSD